MVRGGVGRWFCMSCDGGVLGGGANTLIRTCISGCSFVSEYALFYTTDINVFECVYGVEEC